MGGFSINSRTMAIVGLIIASMLFAYSRMPGGIGGTGITGAPGGIGGTGIYGRIDGFGSIWVNGVEIFYDEDQVVLRQGRDGRPQDLKLGQIVAVVINEETGRAEAQTIEIIEEVNGPIEQLADDQLIILGQKIILTDDTIIDGDLEIGEQRAVNGFRAPDGSIIASRIDQPLIEGELSLRGAVNRAENGKVWINDQELEIQSEQIAVGNTIEVRGRLGAERRRFIINNIKKRRLPFDRRPARISYQGAFENVPTLDTERSLTNTIDTSVIEFRPEIDDEVLNIPRPNAENRVAFRNSFKRERIAKKFAENYMNKRRVDVNAIKENIERIREENRNNNGRTIIIRGEGLRDEIDIDARRQAESESRRQAEVESRRQAEIERRRQMEIERRRQIELDTRRQAELEARRQAELEARRQAEVEGRRQAEIESRRQAEIEAKRRENLIQQQREAATPSLQDFEARRQTQLEALKQAQIEARSEAERTTIRSFEREVRRKTDDEIKEEIRDQVRTQSREEIRETIRQEVRRRLRRQIRQGGIQP